VTERELALLILAASLLLALLGLWQYLSGAGRRADLGERSREGDREALPTRTIRGLDVWFRRTPPGRWLDVRLQAGGVPRSPLEFVLGCYVAFLGGWAVVSLVLPGVAAVLCGLGALVACFVWLDRRREQRALAFVGQLAEISRLLANGAAAGLSLPAAVELAAGELDDPAGAELGRVVEELRLGRPLDEALEALRRRLPSREVAVLLTTLVIQQRAGGDVVRALQDLGEALQARRETRREIRTILAGSVFSSYLVGIIAFGTLLLLNAINPGVMDELTKTAPGLLALLASGTLFVLGFLLIRRTTRIEV
jgi:tight adherence protein B